MTVVALGGSRHISRLNDEVRRRLEKIVQQSFRVVVGDANGADKALQAYFADRSYRNVEVFCSGSAPRNNLGQWTCREIVTKAKPGTFEFYVAKDQAMAKNATVGFMLWDGDSAGTMVNVWRLVQQGKSSLVFMQPQKRFVEVRRRDDLNELLALATVDARKDIEKKIRAETPPKAELELPLFGPDLSSVGLT